MPLPFIIGAIAVATGVGGIGAGVHGGIKMKKASDIVKAAEKRNTDNVLHLENANKKTMIVMDFLGEQEMKIISSFMRFSMTYERIHNAPMFSEIKKEGIELSIFTPQEVKKASVGASVLLGGLGGAAMGSAGGFAAAGGTSAAIMALGTASTGTAISTLGGVAATNATLAALGGGSLAAGGGGVALGTIVLGGTTLGIGLLIGGVIFSITGSTISKKADNAWRQMKENEEKINSICKYLEQLKNIASSFSTTLTRVNAVYEKNLSKLESIVQQQYKKKFFLARLFSKKCNYQNFSYEEKQITENVILLVGLLYEMCKVKLVEKTDDEKELNTINEVEIKDTIANSEICLQKLHNKELLV